jgi:hypothetical protein
MAWPDAEAKCVEWGGNLASIKSEKEHKQIEKLFDDSFSAYWIGYHDKNHENNF